MSTTKKARTPIAPAIVAPDHRHDPLACASCGAIQWNRAPDLFKVYKRFVQRPSQTTAEIAQHFDLSIANASEKIKRLVSMGLVECIASEPIAGVGGRMNTYALVGKA